MGSRLFQHTEFLLGGSAGMSYSEVLRRLANRDSCLTFHWRINVYVDKKAKRSCLVLPRAAFGSQRRGSCSLRPQGMAIFLSEPLADTLQPVNPYIL